MNGLHQRPIDILHRLADEDWIGDDWILDIGPAAREDGGKIVSQDAPETVAKSKTFRTAPFLKVALRI